MTLWQWLTTTPPLVDERDVMARVGFRCVWCTLPYFGVALGLAAFGETRPLLMPVSALMLAIPIVGGLVDWRRVHRNASRSTAA